MSFNRACAIWRPLSGLVAALVMLTSATAVGQTPDGSLILQELRERRKSIENSHLVTRWEEFNKGASVASSSQEIHWDNLGRMRIRSRLAGKSESNNVYNGEFTVHERLDPGLDRLGQPLTDATRRLNDRFHEAIINAGEFPVGGGLKSTRNPLTFLDEVVVGDLTAVLDAKTEVRVSRTAPESTVFEVRYKIAPAPGEQEMEHVVGIDSGKGWVVTKHGQLFADGKLAAESTCEYQVDQKSGLWVPTKGKWASWGTGDVSQPPQMEWQYFVDKASVNDPAFDESVFDVALQPGTYVTDNRYHVSYWVEETPASASNLANLAQQALANAEAKSPVQEFPELVPGIGPFRLGMLVVTAVVIVALAIVIRRSRAKV